MRPNNAYRCGDRISRPASRAEDNGRTGVPNVQYNATAKCHKVSNASKRVKSSYTQND